jgi:hypothetical protein
VLGAPARRDGLSLETPSVIAVAGGLVALVSA